MPALSQAGPFRVVARETARDQQPFTPMAAQGPRCGTPSALGRKQLSFDLAPKLVTDPAVDGELLGVGARGP